MICLSAAVMHAAWAVERRPWVQSIFAEADQANQEVSLIQDTKREGVWPTAKRAWEAIDIGATHHLVLQDDVVLCPNFFEVVKEVIAARPNHPIGPFTRRGACVEAAARGEFWATIDGGAWGPAFILPVPMLREYLAWERVNVRTNFPHDDERLAMFLTATKRPSWATVPSLVEHVATRSLMGHNGKRESRVSFQQPGLLAKARAAGWAVPANPARDRSTSMRSLIRQWPEALHADRRRAYLSGEAS